jgi:hypothetical protein
MTLLGQDQPEAAPAVLLDTLSWLLSSGRDHVPELIGESREG